MYGSQANLGCGSPGTFCLLNRAFYWPGTLCCSWLASQLWNLPVSTFGHSITKYKHVPPCPAFYVGSGDVNSGPNACKPKSLTIELLFQSHKSSSKLLASLRNKFMGTIQCFYSFIFGYIVSRQTCSLKSLMSDLSPLLQLKLCHTE